MSVVRILLYAAGLLIAFAASWAAFSLIPRWLWWRWRQRRWRETFGEEGLAGGFDRMMREIDEESGKRWEKIKQQCGKNDEGRSS